MAGSNNRLAIVRTSIILIRVASIATQLNVMQLEVRAGWPIESCCPSAQEDWHAHLHVMVDKGDEDDPVLVTFQRGSENPAKVVVECGFDNRASGAKTARVVADSARGFRRLASGRRMRQNCISGESSGSATVVLELSRACGWRSGGRGGGAAGTSRGRKGSARSRRADRGAASCERRG